MSSTTVVLGDFNTSLSILGRRWRQMIDKVIKDMHNIVNKLNLADMYSTFILVC